VRERRESKGVAGGGSGCVEGAGRDLGKERRRPTLLDGPEPIRVGFVFSFFLFFLFPFLNLKHIFL
jgi:hypothetical protein